MIERVAEAIYMQSPCLNHFTMDAIEWKNLQGPMKELALNQARAAIEAMREPTKEMEMGVYNHPDYLGYGDDSFKWIYSTMIDEALK